MNEPRECRIREQVFEDEATGLTFQFEVGENGHTYMRIFGPVEKGNREFEFGDTGLLGGVGTVMDGTNRPTWAVNLR